MSSAAEIGAALDVGQLRPPFNKDELPHGMGRRPVDSRGYPVPWFVDMAAPYYNGNPDFRVMDGKHLKLAIRERRCWVCGERITDRTGVFLIGPMCGVNRTTSEPPCHWACAWWSASACPFLSEPKRLRDDRDLPAELKVAGEAILRNPGVAMLWASDNFTTWRPPGGGVLFELGEPSVVAFRCRGRPASRAEIVDSVQTGLPLLLEQAAKQGAEACFQLGMMTGEFMKLVPAEEAAP